MFSRDITGVPTLSPVNMKILLRGRGECRQIKDTPAAVVEVSPMNKGRKRGLVSSEGESLEESPESEIVAVSSTPTRKKIPNKRRIPLKTKLSDKKDDPDWNLEVPPGKRIKLSCKTTKYKNSSSISSEDVVDHKENVKRNLESTTLSLNNNIVPTENNVDQKHDGFRTEEADELTDNAREEHGTTPADNTEILKVAEIYDPAIIKSNGAGVLMLHDIQPDVSVPNLHLRQSQVQDTLSSEQAVKESCDKIDSVGDVCLPPGYGSDKLAILLIRLLEEKVKVSSSHSERELFRMTMHVLQCRGCKDREKHNKVRCRRCEERDRKCEERDRKKNAVKAFREKEQVKKVGQDVFDDLKKQTNMHEDSEVTIRGVDTEKTLMDEGIVENTKANFASVDNNTNVLLERPDEDNDKNDATLELDISCNTCEEKFIQNEFAVHSLQCLKLHVGSKIVNTHAKEQPYLEAAEHEDLGKIDRDKIFEDSDDETGGQIAIDSARHAEASKAPEDENAPNA